MEVSSTRSIPRRSLPSCRREANETAYRYPAIVPSAGTASTSRSIERCDATPCAVVREGVTIFRQTSAPFPDP